MIFSHLSRYQKEIALLLFSVFFSSIYPSMKAQGGYYNNTSRPQRVADVPYTDILYSFSRGIIRNETPSSGPATVATVTSSERIEKTEKSYIDGPGQPEMQSFQSVNANNLVDLFSGDFSYNIPLLDVGGYPLNLHYNSGITMDQEASWVGLGWNVNPGTITRNMRGLPDDFNGQDSIAKTMNIRENVTAGVSGDLKPEIFGFPIGGGPNISGGLFYNNYSGPGFELGINPTIRSSKSSLGDKTFGIDSTNFNIGIKYNSAGGFSANPNFASRLKNIDGGTVEGIGNLGFNLSARNGLTDLTMSFRGTKQFASDRKNNESNNPSKFSHSISFAKNATVPKVTHPFTSLNFSFNLKGGFEAWGFHPSGLVTGYYSKQYIQEGDKTYKVPAYGYLHYQRGNGDAHALLDFNRESDLPYSKKIPHVSIPVYTYDTYSITGEGTGGMFRPYRGDVGYVRDHHMKSKNFSGNFGLDLGFAPNLFHKGLDLTFNYTYTANNEWSTENSLKHFIPFRNADTTFENVYFRNPSEKTSNTQAFYDAVGNSDLIRMQISDDLFKPQATNTFIRYNEQIRSAGSSQLSANALKTTRDKRGQVFSYLTAAEATKVGLDTVVKSYPLNNFLICRSCDSVYGQNGCDTVVRETRINEYRKAHHLSQITVLNPDGRSYVYGIPAYNFVQREATFAVDKDNANLATGLVSYTPGSENSTNNNEGKDHFFSKEETPAYAHSFLLTGVLSPDYVDVTGDGITPDDIGDAVKFNYTKLYGSTNKFKWRTPYAQNTASYNEGLRSDNSDDKGNYVYGEKEIWYLNSVESKTMIATFTLEDRLDSKGVLGEDGGQDNSASLKRVKEINLYAKKDLEKYKGNARPIKTVHFAYSYRLCEGVLNSSADTGKLTLDSLWFTYNKNNKGRQNPYVFKYNPQNPNYHAKAYDRWGNYKPASQNPGGMLNEEFPYAIQNSDSANANVASWTLDTIYLPSGGKMVVSYESDDYAYVQNKRAMQMFNVIGFNNDTTTATVKSKLFELLTDYRYVFLELPSPVQSRTEFFEKYLQGNTKLFFRMLVKMPKDQYGDSSEYVPCYAEYEDYGISYAGSKKVWIKLKPEKGQSPLAFAAIQYLRLNLPSKAFPGSDVQGSTAAGAMIRILFSMVGNISQLLFGFEKNARLWSWAKDITVSKSLVRLNNPMYKKLGGGLRVKKVLLYDNWKKMSGQKESVYGQEYRYTTTKEINGKHQTISSGVATYEPSIGNEENPFHLPLEYTENTSILGPTFGKYIDNPVGESFFPSASIGYSKVTVSSINREKTRSANGFQETEFYTAYDFPVVSAFTPFDNSSRRNFNSPLKYFLPDQRNYLTLTQGFKIELNDMHGKLKAQRTYAETDSTKPISSTHNIYLLKSSNPDRLKLDNLVPLMNDGIVTNGTVGKDIELMVDLREQKSETFGVNVQFNKSAFLIGIFLIPVPSFVPKPNHSLNLYRAATVMKVVQSYGILDSIVHTEKGSTVSVKNMVYDPETGDPVLTRTQNEFDDPVYNFNYLSHWGYEGTGLAYKNIGTTLKNQTLFEGRLNTTYNDKFFVSGDEVLVTAKEGAKSCGGSYAYNNYFTTKKLWAVAANKIGETSGIYFIDREGKAYTGSNVDLKVIRSGRKNMPSVSIGSVSTLKLPLQTISSQLKLHIVDTTKVIAASAVEMNEDWKEDRIRTTCDDTTLAYSINPYVHGMLGNWRAQKSYTYYGRRSESDPSAGTDIRKNGTFATFLPFWIFITHGGSTRLTSLVDTTKWVWNAEATLFNRKGYELENKDPLGRYNAGLYGHNKALPVAVAQNAKYREIMYEGFEDFSDSTFCIDSCHLVKHSGFSDPLPYSPFFTDSSLLDPIEKHTGRYSMALRLEDKFEVSIPVSSDSSTLNVPFDLSNSYNAGSFCEPRVSLTLDNYISKFSPIRSKKIVFSFWFKTSLADCNDPEYTGTFVYNLHFLDNAGQPIAGTLNSSQKFSNIEGWVKVERVYTVPQTAVSMQLEFQANGGKVNIDDIRIHPFNSNMKTFVYHPTNLRLMAELDENNYASFYEYDDEGTLVRVKKETVKGIKTIKETRSSLLKD